MVDISNKFIFDGLEEKGRLQFFSHSCSSKLPVRDVCNEQGKGYKTEPHIEIGAENYISCCYQPNIIKPFLKSKEKYLFLFTTCSNETLKDFVGKRFIVGYIVKQRHIYFPKTKDCENCKEKVREKCDGRYAVKGETKLFSFAHAYPLDKLVKKEKVRYIRCKNLSSEETKKILNHFKNGKDIRKECVEEIERLDPEKKTCKKSHHKKCEFETICLRGRKNVD